MTESSSAPEVLALAQLVSVQPGAVVSRTLLKRPSGNITVFAFDKGQELSEHTTPHDAFLQVVEGEAEIRIDGRPFRLVAGEAVHLPADVPHAVAARAPFKMMLVMLKA